MAAGDGQVKVPLNARPGLFDVANWGLSSSSTRNAGRCLVVVMLEVDQARGGGFAGARLVIILFHTIGQAGTAPFDVDGAKGLEGTDADFSLVRRRRLVHRSLGLSSSRFSPKGSKAQWLGGWLCFSEHSIALVGEGGAISDEHRVKHGFVLDRRKSSWHSRR